MWHYNKKVVATYVHHTTQYAYASIEGLGWRRIKTGAADGVTNVFAMMCAAKANDRPVHVYVDSGNLIATGYLL